VEGAGQFETWWSLTRKAVHLKREQPDQIKLEQPVQETNTRVNNRKERKGASNVFLRHKDLYWSAKAHDKERGMSEKFQKTLIGEWEDWGSADGLAVSI